MKFADNARVLMEKMSSSCNDNTLPKSFYDNRTKINRMKPRLQEISAALRKWVKAESQWASTMSEMHCSMGMHNEDIWRNSYTYFSSGNSTPVRVLEKAQLSLKLKTKYLNSMIARCDEVESLFLLKNRAQRKLESMKSKVDNNQEALRKAQDRFESAQRLFDAEFEKLNDDIDFLFAYSSRNDNSGFGAAEINLLNVMQQDFFRRCSECVYNDFTPYEYDANDFVVFDTCRVSKLFRDSIDEVGPHAPIRTSVCISTGSSGAEEVGNNKSSSTDSLLKEKSEEEPKVENSKPEHHVTFAMSTRFSSKKLNVQDEPQEEHFTMALQKFETC